MVQRSQVEADIALLERFLTGGVAPSELRRTATLRLERAEPCEDPAYTNIHDYLWWVLTDPEEVFPDDPPDAALREGIQRAKGALESYLRGARVFLASEDLTIWRLPEPSLEYLRTLGFQVGWHTLLVAWQTNDRYCGLLSEQEILAHARHVVDRPEARSEALCRLAKAEPGDRETIRDSLVRLANEAGGDPELERRKWRAALLKERLANLPDDPVQALTELSEFRHYGAPFEGFCQEYEWWSEDHPAILREHEAWLGRELRELKGK